MDIDKKQLLEEYAIKTRTVFQRTISSKGKNLSIGVSYSIPYYTQKISSLKLIKPVSVYTVISASTRKE